jgi:hypothetical protein
VAVFIRDAVNILANAYQKSNYGNYMAPTPGCNLGIVVNTMQGRRVIGCTAWKLEIPDFEVCLETGEFD